MSQKIMTYLLLAAVLGGTVYVGWKFTARGAYESAEYRVVEADGAFEVRQYSPLMVAATDMNFRSQGDDGSFMRLFRYISGDNARKQKVAMTTPVFMDPDSDGDPGEMAFVIPKEVATEGVPSPAADSVRIRQRPGGRFAVIRFSGRINDESYAQAEKRLRQWIQSRDLATDTEVEFAGYDPPWTPGPLRRNEVLIRLK